MRRRWKVSRGCARKHGPEKGGNRSWGTGSKEEEKREEKEGKPKGAVFMKRSDNANNSLSRRKELTSRKRKDEDEK